MAHSSDTTSVIYYLARTNINDACLIFDDMNDLTNLYLGSTRYKVGINESIKSKSLEISLFL